MNGLTETNIAFRDCVSLGDKIIFSNSDANGLFSLELSSGRLKFLSLFRGEDVKQRGLHCRSIKYQDRIYFIPLLGKEIACVNLNDYCVSNIPLHQEIVKREKTVFLNAHLYADKIFMFPGKAEWIEVLDIKENRVRKLMNWKEQLKAKGYVVSSEQLLINQMGIYENRAFLLVYKTNVLILFDMEKECMEQVVELPKGNYAYATVMDGKIWVFPDEEGDVITLSLDLKEVQVFGKSTLKKNNENLPASGRSICFKNQIFLFPTNCREMGILDSSQGTFKTNATVMKQAADLVEDEPVLRNPQKISEAKVIAICTGIKEQKHFVVEIDLDLLEIKSCLIQEFVNEAAYWNAVLQNIKDADGYIEETKLPSRHKMQGLESFLRWI